MDWVQERFSIKFFLAFFSDRANSQKRNIPPEGKKKNSNKEEFCAVSLANSY